MIPKYRVTQSIAPDGKVATVNTIAKLITVGEKQVYDYTGPEAYLRISMPTIKK